jgi:hypothetical protein
MYYVQLRNGFKILKERTFPYTELKLPPTRSAGRTGLQDRLSIEPPFKSATTSYLYMLTYSVFIDFPSRIFYLP